MLKSWSIIIHRALIVLAGRWYKLITVAYWTPIQVKGSFFWTVLAISAENCTRCKKLCVMEIGRSSNTCINCQDSLLIREGMTKPSDGWMFWHRLNSLIHCCFFILQLFSSMFVLDSWLNQLLMLVVVTALVGHECELQSAVIDHSSCLQIRLPLLCVSVWVSSQ